MTNLCLVESFSNDGLGLGIDGFSMNGEPVFHAVRVAEMLGYNDPHQAIKTHCKSVIKLTSVACTEVNLPKEFYYQMGATFIKESDLYRLIMRSKLPSAERFQDWVVEEVLPAIRKYGHFSLEPKSKTDIEIYQELSTEAMEMILRIKKTDEAKILQISSERDEAIRTKAQISDSKVAKAMNTASIAAKKVIKVEKELNDLKERTNGLLKREEELERICKNIDDLYQSDFKVCHRGCKQD